MFMTAIPKVPPAEYEGLHPGGALAVGVILEVTPCG